MHYYHRLNNRSSFNKRKQNEGMNLNESSNNTGERISMIKEYEDIYLNAYHFLLMQTRNEKREDSFF